MLGVHPIIILVMGIFNFNPIIMIALLLFSPFNMVITYKDNRPLKI